MNDATNALNESIDTLDTTVAEALYKVTTFIFRATISYDNNKVLFGFIGFREELLQSQSRANGDDNICVFIWE